MMDDDVQIEFDEDDYCYECGGYGDDYYINDEGEMVRRCPQCPFYKRDDEWEDR